MSFAQIDTVKTICRG